MSDQPSGKQYKTEWSFSFDKIGEQFNKIGERFNQAVSDFAGEEEIRSETFTAARESASTAYVQIDLSIGRSSVSALAEESDNILEANLSYVGEVAFSVTGDAEKVVRLRQKSDNQVSSTLKRALKSFGSRADLRWDVQLSRTMPIRLEIDGGVGPATLDLTGIQLTHFNLEGGVGEITLTLPSGTYQSSIEGGVGATNVHIPEDAAGKLNIDGGVGAVRIQIPYQTAVRITVDGNLGGVRMPDHFVRVKESDDFIGSSGTWETPGFNMAEKQLVIDYEGGVGSLTLRTDITHV